MLEHLNLQPGKLVLEIGCGTGATLVKLQQQYKCNVSAIDLSQKMLKRARRKVRNHSGTYFFQADASAGFLPFGSETFDVVLAESVAGILDFSSSLPEWVRVLKPGGTLALNDGLWRTDVPAATVKRFTGLCVQKFGFSLAPRTPQSREDWKRLMTSIGLTNIRTLTAAKSGEVIRRDSRSRRQRRRAILFRPHLWPAYVRYRRSMKLFSQISDHLEYWIFLAQKPYFQR
jgi:SAM-dependent methyltransferase